MLIWSDIEFRATFSPSRQYTDLSARTGDRLDFKNSRDNSNEILADIAEFRVRLIDIQCLSATETNAYALSLGHYSTTPYQRKRGRLLVFKSLSSHATPSYRNSISRSLIFGDWRLIPNPLEHSAKIHVSVFNTAIYDTVLHRVSPSEPAQYHGHRR
jgi:hypothetical protein